MHVPALYNVFEMSLSVPYLDVDTHPCLCNHIARRTRQDTLPQIDVAFTSHKLETLLLQREELGGSSR